MTRLKDDWIKDMCREIEDEQRGLFAKTGLDYAALAGRAAGISRERLLETSKNIKAAVVPVTAGQGVIGHFSDSVAAILGATGFDAFVTGCTDASGVLEGCRQGANVIFMADDNQFVALNTTLSIVADNNNATTLGFLTALDAASGGLAGKEVLVAGCGVLGKQALGYLRSMDARPFGFDTNPRAIADVNDLGFEMINDPSEIGRFKYIFDATNTGGWLTEDMLHPEALISAPGVPLSLTDRAKDVFERQLIHDLLPIGVAVMMGLVCGG